MTIQSTAAKVDPGTLAEWVCLFGMFSLDIVILWSAAARLTFQVLFLKSPYIVYNSVTWLNILSLSVFYISVIKIPEMIQSPGWLVLVIIVYCCDSPWNTFERVTGMLMSQPACGPGSPRCTRPIEVDSQQGSWFMGHFTSKAWGRSAACPTILNLGCQVWRCRSSVSVKAYLHCSVKLSVVTTACLFSLGRKCVFVFRAIWFRQ